MIETTIYCDHCGRAGYSSRGKDRKHAHQIREEQRKVGWITFPPYDLCPPCANARNASKSWRPIKEGTP